MRCDKVHGRLAEVASGEVVLGPEEQGHVERCLRCQAELAQHRRVLHTMRALRHQAVEPASGVLGDVLGALADAGERGAVRGVARSHRAVYIGGLAAATAAGAAGAIVLAARSRRPRAAAG